MLVATKQTSFIQKRLKPAGSVLQTHRQYWQRQLHIKLYISVIMALLATVLTLKYK